MQPTWAVVVVLLMLVGSLGLLSLYAHPTGASRATVAPATRETPGALPPTHGDLVVGPGQVYTIQPTLAGHVYYQGGNITVEQGGTLIVRNVTLSFVQFVSDTGTPLQRLSHIYQFRDDGTVAFWNSTLTTDVSILNAYAKLDLTVTANLTAWNSTFAFPGWITASGPTAIVTLNDSLVEGNPSVAALLELPAIYGDTLYAPTISALDGSHLNLLHTTVNGTYADDQLTWGIVRPAPLYYSTPIDLSSTYSIPQLNTSTDSANLTLAWSYPDGVARGGYFAVYYEDTNSGPSSDTTVSVTVGYNGTNYPLGSVLFKNSSSGVLTLQFTPALVAAISASGLLNYLNYTGDYGGLPSKISLSYTTVSGPGVRLTESVLQLNTTGVSYDINVSSSTLSTVDSALALTWNFMPAGDNPYSLVPPVPWGSNKLLLENGAIAYLANLTVPSIIPGVYSASAVQPDGSSQAYLYRWAQFNLTGRGGNLAVEGAHLSAYYAYDTNQANNVTVTGLNNIAATDPAIWGYLQYWDSVHGVPSYGSSNAAGSGFLLLASSNITGATLPDGQFLGGYHVGISVPANSIGSHWFDWAVSPYPTGVAMGTAYYSGPDIGPAQSFANYYGAMTLSTPVVLANGSLAPNASVRIGQKLSVEVTLVDSGTATITQVGGQLWYNATSKIPVATANSTGLDLTTPGQTYTFNLSWVINDTVTGLHKTFLNSFPLTLEFNLGIVNRGGGVIDSDAVVTIQPSQIRIISFQAPASTTIDLTQQYFSAGQVQFNGSQDATVQLFATPASGGSPIEIATVLAPTGKFDLEWFPLQQLLSAGTTYKLSVVATYNGVSTTYNVPGEYSVPAPPTSPTSFLTQTILGLPLWVWLAIAAAIVAGLLGFLVLARRQAAGKLVECGECGNLIPEDATVCPKCGAEFEADLIRCSRCASTIPADSKFCPECAAQLLGKPGEGEADPERQGYADFTEKYRAEGKRELGENYSEGAFWDWWKRQPTYTSFSQWKLQQGTGTPRGGMTAPPPAGAAYEEAPPAGRPPKGGGAAGAPPPSAPPVPPPVTGPAAAAPTAAPGGPLRACPNCSKEIPPEYLVCPFCGAVTQ
jgi:RNA polymerase subunit RPABC4/transcription elongation factor Spt4